MNIGNSRSVASAFNSARGSTTPHRARALRIALLLGCTALPGLLGSQAAADTKWTGGAGSSDWGDAGNWSFGVPGGNDEVFITITTPNSPVISSGAGISDSIFIGPQSSDVGILTVSGANSSLSVTGTLSVGDSGQGAFNIVNGAAVTSGDAYIGGGNGSGIGTATVAGIGSTWTISSDVVLGDQVGHGILNISDGGTVAVGGVVTITDQSTSIGTLNIGNGGAAGMLNAASIQFGAGTGTINFNHTNTNYIFAPDISGNGTINHIAGTTTFTGDSSGFMGTTYVTGGKLNVAGALGGTVDINAGGALGGDGNVGAVVVNAGGILAPGSSVGSLSVTNATFNAGSVYTVELNKGGDVPGINNDHISASGAVTINGGTVHVTPANGTDTGQTYTPGLKYTIITAAGGVNGKFDGLTDDYAYLDFKLTYTDPLAVFLTSQLVTPSFCLPGMSANQCAAGNGVFSLGGGQLFDAVLNLTAAQAPGALNLLSGEIHASAKSMLLDDSRFARDAALNRLRAWSGGIGASNAPVSVMDAYGAYTKAPPTTDSIAIWGQGFGSWGQWNGNGNAARLDRDTGGFIVGVDEKAFDTWRIGAFGGYSTTRFNINARNSSGSSDNYHVGAYGGTGWASLALRSGVAYAWHDLKTTRHVAFPGFADTLKASYNAGTAQAFGELAYGFRQAGAGFEPFANLAYVSLRTDGFTETGGAAALRSASSVIDATFTTLGLRASTGFDLGTASALGRGSLGWRHAYGDTLPASAVAFAGGTPFTITGVPIAQDAVVLDLGLDFNLRSNTTLGISYGGQFGASITDQTVRANLTARF